jgi:hypothetical protein
LNSKFIIKNPTILPIIRNNALFLIKAAVIKKICSLLFIMRWIRLIVGELLLLFASILVFRSAWTLLDEYLGKSNLWLMLVLGIFLTVVALILLDYEVKCELEKKKQF